jgi:hypothetical protein
MNGQTRTVRAIKAEVYSRVVGYYRPVQNWNRGKKEEFGERHNMTPQELGMTGNAIEIHAPICENGICKVG